MKSVILFFALSLILLNANAENSAYVNAMKDNIDKLHKATTVDELQNISNQFERIATTEKDKWLPFYYASYSNISISFMDIDDDEKDRKLDHAQKLLDKALEIAKDESELYALQGYLLTARIHIKPMTRGPQYLSDSNMAYKKAIELNPNNPRPYYLSGLTVYGTPAFFGGGAKNALPLLEKAKERFDKQDCSDGIKPCWGKDHNEQTLNACKK